MYLYWFLNIMLSVHRIALVCASFSSDFSNSWRFSVSLLTLWCFIRDRSGSMSHLVCDWPLPRVRCPFQSTVQTQEMLSVVCRVQYHWQKVGVYSRNETDCNWVPFHGIRARATCLAFPNNLNDPSRSSTRVFLSVWSQSCRELD